MDTKIFLLGVTLCFIKWGITRGDDIYCWATCDLGNCGNSVVQNDSFVNCTWKSNSSIASDCNMTLHDQYQHKCNVQAKCKKGMRTCEAIFHKKNCDLLARRNERMILWVSDAQRSMVSILRLRICEIGKPNPPGIKVKVIDKTNKIRVSNAERSCVANVDYRLNFSYTDEDGYLQKDTLSWSEFDEPETVPFLSGTEYNFSLESSKYTMYDLNRVYSDPSVCHNFVTSPGTAFDGHFEPECDEKFPERIVATWKKSGKIDFFEVTLIDEESDESITSTRVNKTSSIERNFRVEFDNLTDTWQNYSIGLVAYNKVGKSRPARRNILRKHCKNIPEMHCDVSNRKPSHFDVRWISDWTDSVLVTVSSDGEEVSRSRFGTGSGSYRQTGVQKCRKYTASIGIPIGSNEFVLCAKEVLPVENDVPPLIKLIRIGEKTVEFQGLNNHGSCNNSDKFVWRIGDRGWKNGTLGSTIRVRSLQPKTKYQVEVKMDNARSSTTSCVSTLRHQHKRTMIKADNGSLCSGNDCSTGSPSVNTKKDDASVNSFPPMIVLSISCGALILVVAAIGCLYHIRKKPLSSAYPRMHPDLQKQFDKEAKKILPENDATNPELIHSNGDDSRTIFLI